MFARTFSKWCSAIALTLACALTSSPSRAQCGPDGLDGPCCGVANANIPFIPSITQDMRWICFDQCLPALNNLYCVKIGSPIPKSMGGGQLCGVYSIRFTVTNCGAVASLYNGKCDANYQRTWLETPVAGAAPIQVYRFLVNGDFAATAAVPNTPCDRPGCTVQYNRVYFTGYIDYALNCATNSWTAAFGLTHECDGIHHAAGTVRPAPAAGFHPSRSFTMVSPGATFAVNSTAPIQSDGPIIQQAMRWNDWTTAPMICRFREPTQGNLIAGNQFCFCNTAGAPQYINTMVTAQSACGSSVNPSPIGPFLQKRIGGWTVAASFPGPEFLLFDIGRLNHVNGCTGVNSQEWFEGVETIGGYPATDFAGVALGRQFEDVESCNTSATNPATRIGAGHTPYYLLNFNLP